MYNAIYGKTMENLRNRIDVKFVSKQKRLFKMEIKLLPAMMAFKDGI